MLLELLTLLGAVALLLYGMLTLSNGLQKLLGDKVRKFFPWMKGSPARQLLSGVGLTASILSSGATTVMVVSLVNSGLLLLSQAVGVIFGANIGTTLTAWLITFFGFTLDIRLAGFPLLAFGFIFMMSKKRRNKTISELIIGTALIFIGLLYMKESMADLRQEACVLTLLESWSGKGFLSVLIYLFVGIGVAFLLQSSSATIALTLIMTGAGWIPFRLAAAIVLGANIGTTLTAGIAAVKGNVQARRAALIHLLFNTSGVVLLLIFFEPFMAFCRGMCSLFGAGDITSDFVPGAAGGVVGNGQLYALCAVHTLFNLVNSLILIWFSKPIVRFVTFLAKDRPAEQDPLLKYIGIAPLGTPAVSITQAFDEIVNFGEISYEGFGYVRKAVNERDSDKFEEYRAKLVEYEEIADRMEASVAQFLNKIVTGGINGSEAEGIKILYRIIGELESLGDSGENISRILDRERIHNRKFDEETIARINLMIDKVEAAYRVMNDNLRLTASLSITSIENAYAAEEEINLTRNQLRDYGIARIENMTGNYQSLNYFLDILAELEAMGDFIINISQAAVERR